MAYLHHLLQQSYADSFFSIREQVNKFRDEEIAAAIKIQSWFRSRKTRSIINFLHRCATTIQKEYRGHLSRQWYRNLVTNHINKLLQEHYDAQVTKIQAIWRGYATRKFKANYYSRKAFLQGLEIKNEQMTQYLKETERNRKLASEQEKHEQERMATLYNLRKTHYLLSTQVRDGIYNAHSNPRPYIEAALQNVSPLSAYERKRITTERREKRLCSVVGIPRTLEAEAEVEKVKELPSLVTEKPQGPFRRPESVREQRLKGFRPTLRVDTDYESAECARARMYRNEWTKRIIDKKFIPSRKADKVRQGPTLRTASCYEQLDYGSKHFRDCNRGKRIHGKAFQSVLPSIPLFDQVGKTY